ncbi:MAG TPA: hypothetical protein ENK05_05810 [Gammaproteobacteria bacterium]|nr:hypothetical protein [Gammaproteobacteria bacterium]
MKAARGLAGWLLAALVLMAVAARALPAAETRGSVLWYQEQESGTGPYPVRYLVTEDWLRSDDGSDQGDFLLFDRRERRIYSVVREERTILRIDGQGTPPAAPSGFALETRQEPDNEAPRIGGRAPLRLELHAGGQLCHTALVAPGLLDDARAAFEELSQALRVQQGRTLASTPAEFRTPCFLARYLYAGDFYLSQGISLADWDEQGRRRQLVRFETDVNLDDRLFRLPADYRYEEAGTR